MVGSAAEQERGPEVRLGAQGGLVVAGGWEGALLAGEVWGHSGWGWDALDTLGSKGSEAGEQSGKLQGPPQGHTSNDLRFVGFFPSFVICRAL